MDGTALRVIGGSNVIPRHIAGLVFREIERDCQNVGPMVTLSPFTLNMVGLYGLQTLIFLKVLDFSCIRYSEPAIKRHQKPFFLKYLKFNILTFLAKNK